MKVYYLFASIVFLLIGCSNTTDVTTEPDLIDYRNKKSYRTVKIGSQVWMAENLDVATFRNGDLIQEARTVPCHLSVGHDSMPIFHFLLKEWGECLLTNVFLWII